MPCASERMISEAVMRQLWELHVGENHVDSRLMITIQPVEA